MRLKHEAPWRRRSNKSLLPHHWALKGLRLQAFNMCQLGFVFHADCGGYGVMGSETPGQASCVWHQVCHELLRAGLGPHAHVITLACALGRTTVLQAHIALVLHVYYI